MKQKKKRTKKEVDWTSFWRGRSMRENKVLHGCREILVTDPDGYLLRFSEDIGEKSTGID